MAEAPWGTHQGAEGMYAGDDELAAAWGASTGAPAQRDDSGVPPSPSRLKRPPPKVGGGRQYGGLDTASEAGYSEDDRSEAGYSDASGYTARGVAAAWASSTTAPPSGRGAKGGSGRPDSGRSKLTARNKADRGGGVKYRQFRGMAWPPSRPPPDQSQSAPRSVLIPPPAQRWTRRRRLDAKAPRVRATTGLGWS